MPGAPTEEWTSVGPVGRFAARAITALRIAGVDAIVVRNGDRFYAFERACPHEQADLSMGDIRSGRLACPRHMASFDIESGRISAGWNCRDLHRFPTAIADGRLMVDVGHAP